MLIDLKNTPFLGQEPSWVRPERGRLRKEQERQQKHILHICRVFEFYKTTWPDAWELKDYELLRFNNFGRGSLELYRMIGRKPRIRVKMGRLVC